MLFARQRRGRPARRMTNNALTVLARWRLTPSGIAKFLWGKPATRSCGLRLRTPLMASLKRSNFGDALQPLVPARQCHNHVEEPGRKQQSAYPGTRASRPTGTSSGACMIFAIRNAPKVRLLSEKLSRFCIRASHLLQRDNAVCSVAGVAILFDSVLRHRRGGPALDPSGRSILEFSA